MYFTYLKQIAAIIEIQKLQPRIVSQTKQLGSVDSPVVIHGTGTFIPNKLPKTVYGRQETAINVKTFITLFNSLL